MPGRQRFKQEPQQSSDSVVVHVLELTKRRLQVTKQKLAEFAVQLQRKRYGTRCSAIAEKPRCRVRYSPIAEDWNWETIFYGHYRSIFNHCDTGLIGLKICLIA